MAATDMIPVIYTDKLEEAKNSGGLIAFKKRDLIDDLISGLKMLK